MFETICPDEITKRWDVGSIPKRQHTCSLNGFPHLLQTKNGKRSKVESGKGNSYEESYLNAKYHLGIGGVLTLKEGQLFL